MGLSQRTYLSAEDMQPEASNLRAFERVTLDQGAVQLEVMRYRRDEPAKRPLIIINSIEYPMPPSVPYCEQMWQSGLQVVFIRRLGFGGTRGLPKVLLSDVNIQNGAAVMTETAIVNQLIKTLSLKDAVLMGIGSGNPVCYRLASINSDISFSVFANPVFNQDSWIGFRPAWFRTMLRQSVMTKNGFRIATSGLKFYLKKNQKRFFEQMLQKSEADQNYVASNQADCVEATRLMCNITGETFHYDLSMSLRTDTFLKDGLFSNFDAVALCGPDTTEEWRTETVREATRLEIPIVRTPSGGMFAAYISPETVLETIERSKCAKKL